MIKKSRFRPEITFESILKNVTETEEIKKTQFKIPNISKKLRKVKEKLPEEKENKILVKKEQKRLSRKKTRFTPRNRKHLARIRKQEEQVLNFKLNPKYICILTLSD